MSQISSLTQKSHPALHGFQSIFWVEAARGSEAVAEHSVLLWGWADVTNRGLLIAEKQQVLLSEKHL